jgi:uncharacterized protein YozE (UPF0346 family)
LLEAIDLFGLVFWSHFGNRGKNAKKNKKTKKVEQMSDAKPVITYVTASKRRGDAIVAAYVDMWLKHNPVIMSHNFAESDYAKLARMEISRAIDRQMVVAILRDGELCGYVVFEDMFPNKFDDDTVFPEFSEFLEENAEFAHRYAFWRHMEEPVYSTVGGEDAVSGRYLRAVSGALLPSARGLGIASAAITVFPHGARDFVHYYDFATTQASQHCSRKIGMETVLEMKFADWEVDGRRPYVHMDWDAILFYYPFHERKDKLHFAAPEDD